MVVQLRNWDENGSRSSAFAGAGSWRGELDAIIPSVRPGNLADLPAFSGDTLLCTRRGQVAAADLHQGDEVLTRDSGYVCIAWAAHLPEAAPAIVLRAGTFGNASDLVLSAGHGIMLSHDDFLAQFGAREVIVPAEALIDGDRVTPAPGRMSHAILLAMTTHEIVLADGLWVETLQADAETADLLSRHVPGSPACPGDDTGPARPVLVGREADAAARIAGFGRAALVAIAAA